MYVCMYVCVRTCNVGKLDAFQTLVGVAQAQPQVVIATVAPPAAQEVHQEEDESPDGLPDGDGSGGAEKTGAWPQRDKLDLVRLDAARQIQTGWVPSGFTFHEKLSGWKPEASKPRQSELWQAIMERDPSQKPKHWDVKKCVALHPNLRTHLDRTFLNSHLMRKTRQMSRRKRILALLSPIAQKMMKNYLRSFAESVLLNHCLDQ